MALEATVLIGRLWGWHQTIQLRILHQIIGQQLHLGHGHTKVMWSRRSEMVWNGNGINENGRHLENGLAWVRQCTEAYETLCQQISQARSIDWCMIFYSALIITEDISETNRIHFFETPCMKYIDNVVPKQPESILRDRCDVETGLPNKS